MALLIILLGALTSLAGVAIVINPEIIFGLLRNSLDKLVLHITAVIVRLFLGALLVVQSSVSRFPFAIEVIGWVVIVAAVFLAIMGRSNFKRLMLWALSLGKPVGRIGGVIAIAFGVFLVYTFV